MCGIVGAIGERNILPVLLDGLLRLEYRGYDSAGIATLNDGVIERRRAEGKLLNLEERLSVEPLVGTTGIGHTRWATHGVPNEENAHPHATSRVVIVHNGIIENFQELRAELIEAGHQLTSDTDTEVIVHLIDKYLDDGMAPKDATSAVLKRLQGAFALAIIFGGESKLMIAARVMRIMCATTTRVRVRAGKMHRKTRSQNGISEPTFEMLGNQPAFTERNKIKM